MRKALLLVFLLLIVSSVSSVQLNNGGVEYLSYSDISVDCGDNCPTGRYVFFELDACGNSFEVSRGARFDQLQESDYPINIEFAVPYTTGILPSDNQLPCSYGDHNIEVRAYRGATKELVDEDSATLSVREKGDMNANVARYLYFGLRDDTDPNRLNNLFLSDTDPGYSNVDPNYGKITKSDPLIVYNDKALLGGQEAATKAEAGTELTQSASSKINDIAKLTDEDGAPICTYENGGVNDAGCEIGEETMSGSNNRLSESNYHSTPTISPIHRRGEYYLNGDIRVGYYPEFHINSGTQEGPLNDFTQDDKLFFICREGAEMPVDTTEDISTSQVMNAQADGQDLYKCDQDTGEWYSVEECNDGIDNDGDGTIDGSNDYNAIGTDPSCEKGNDESATIDGCDTAKVYERTVYEPQFGEEIGIGEYYAKYETGDGCQTTDYTDWDWVENGEPKSPVEYSCNILDDPNNPDCSNDLGENGWDEMPHVEYGAHPQYFEQLAEAKGKDLTTEGVETQFVEQNNGWVTQKQGIYTAEKKFDAGQLDNELTPSSCDQCHSYDWWNNLNMTEIDGYQDDGTLGHEDAWNTYNAGANITDEVDSDMGSPFTGGYGGNCPDGFEWEDSSTYPSFDTQFWECEGEKPPPPGDGPTITGSCCDNDDETQVPGIKPSVVLPETSTQGETREIGLILMPYLHKDSRPDYIPGDVKTYDELMQGTTLDGDNIESMDVQCWAGKTSDQPDDCSSTDSCFTEQDVAVSSSDPYGTSQEVNTGSETNYACSWRYNTEQRTDPIIGDSLIELHKQQGSGDEYNGFWDDLTNTHSNLREDYTDGGLGDAIGSWN
jgi:hypothetical protein